MAPDALGAPSTPSSAMKEGQTQNADTPSAARNPGLSPTDDVVLQAAILDSSLRFASFRMTASGWFSLIEASGPIVKYLPLSALRRGGFQTFLPPLECATLVNRHSRGGGNLGVGFASTNDTPPGSMDVPQTTSLTQPPPSTPRYKGRFANRPIHCPTHKVYLQLGRHTRAGPVD